MIARLVLVPTALWFLTSCGKSDESAACMVTVDEVKTSDGAVAAKLLRSKLSCPDRKTVVQVTDHKSARSRPVMVFSGWPSVRLEFAPYTPIRGLRIRYNFERDPATGEDLTRILEMPGAWSMGSSTGIVESIFDRSLPPVALADPHDVCELARASEAEDGREITAVAALVIGSHNADLVNSRNAWATGCYVATLFPADPETERRGWYKESEPMDPQSMPIVNRLAVRFSPEESSPLPSIAISGTLRVMPDFRRVSGGKSNGFGYHGHSRVALVVKMAREVEGSKP
jgi:hypothetical protein